MTLRTRVMALAGGVTLLLGLGGVLSGAGATSGAPARTAPVVAAPAAGHATAVPASDEALCFGWPAFNLYLCA